MDALRTINRDDGITVLCNLHTLDMAQRYCDRLIGLTRGTIVFDGPPAALTRTALREIYGIEDGGEEGHAALLSEDDDLVPAGKE